eukprot:417141-Pyramimonas_sp.AAC.1
MPIERARMTASFFKAESAAWSASAQQAVLELVYDGGSHDSIEHGRIFNEKDKRRVKLSVALL